jgi:MOB kinase activator 1
LAEHVETFQEQVQRIFQPIEDKCTSKSCPEMTAGPKYSYLWADDKQTDPISLPAKEYIHTLLEWVLRLYKDEKIFPPKTGTLC